MYIYMTPKNKLSHRVTIIVNAMKTIKIFFFLLIQNFLVPKGSLTSFSDKIKHIGVEVKRNCWNCKQ